MLYEYKLDTQAQIAYARRWALDRNPAFYDFEYIGGDCTSFVSQCILAGKAAMNYTPDIGWYYISASDRAAAWTGVDFFYRFITGNKEVGPFGVLTDLSKAAAGDVIQLGDSRKFYHSLFVLENKGEIRVAAHTNDVFGKNLYDYTFERVRCIHILGARRWE